jgi:hypothetical protein
MKPWLHSFSIAFGLGAAFVLGQWCAHPGVLEAQGRSPTNPPPADPRPLPDEEAPGQPVVYAEEGGHTSSGNGFVAVTGSYGVGTSVLYLVDTVNRQLAVYEARGGSTEQRRIVLVGARKLDLDLKLEGYNDRSEYDYRRLKDVFDKRGRRDVDVKTGLEPDGARK